MKKTPFAHQKEGVRWLVSHGQGSKNGVALKGRILSDEQGLGKTLTALLAANVHVRTQKVDAVIIAPTSVLHDWKRESNALGLNARIYSWHRLPASIEETVIKEKKHYKAVACKSLPKKFVLIIDEAHLAQNKKSARARKVMAIAADPRCVAAYPLTGTPLKNGRPANLFTLLKIVNHHLAQNEHLFETKYCEGHFRICVAEDKIGKKGKKRRKVWDNTGAANLPELHNEIQNAVLRRLKSDCLDLPPKLRNILDADLTPEQQADYDRTFQKCREAWFAKVKNGHADGTADAIVLLGQLRMAASLAKIPTTLGLVADLIEQGRRPVIFTEFLESAQAIAKEYGVRVFCGDMSSDERAEYIQNFQDGTLPVFVGTVKAGGVGITLTASQDIILHDRPWTPGDAAQVEDRVHRIGQTGTVNVYWIRYGHIDEKVDTTIERKMVTINTVLHNDPLKVTFFHDLAESIWTQAA